MAGKLTPREVSQRFRRKRERAAGRPKIGRPRGSKTEKDTSYEQVMSWYDRLHEQGFSWEVAGAVIRAEFGKPFTEVMVQTWRDNRMIRHRKSTRAPMRRSKSGRFVSRGRL